MSGLKAVFLDRDGTIISDAHYLSDPADVKLLPRAREAIALFRDAGFMLFLFTNQSGVGRGLFPLEAVHRCNARMIELLGFGSDLFTEICIAPETPDEPAVYRKPNPRFINESIARYGIDRSRAWMVGDKPIDVESGLNAGIKAARIGKLSGQDAGPGLGYESLFAFAEMLTTQTV